MVEEFLKFIAPRKYQTEIYEICKEKNCLVVLPTGIGKTLIALMLSVYTQKKSPATKTLFLAPTKPLAEQHLNYFKKHLPELFAEFSIFTGKVSAEKRKKLWENSDIIFSTPQCISNDLKNNLYTLENVSLLIEDECHRCLKNYAYTYIADKYKDQSKNGRVLGITASPGTDKSKISQIAINLGIESIEVRTRESEDVKEYLQELNFQIIKVELSEEFKEIDSIIKNIYNKKIQELKNRKLFFNPPTKINLIKLQEKIMSSISSGNKNFNIFSGASACAQALKLAHLIELFQTQTIYTSLNYIKSLYNQASEKKSRAVQQLVKNPLFNKAYIKINDIASKNIEHPKLLKLIELIRETMKNTTKIIVFSQYRDTVTKICKELNNIEGIRSKVFIGQAKKSDKGLSQKEQQEIIKDFREGKINIICSTSIGEEGLDIPEVNAVIFYEPVPSAIRKIQRAGRTARLMKGSLIILMTLDTLDEIFYYASRSKEKKMYKSIESVKKDLDSGFLITNKNNKKEESQKTLF